MPFQLHRPGTHTPSILTESDDTTDPESRSARQEMQESAWKRLNQGERIFVKAQPAEPSTYGQRCL
ncbi:MAG: hypothetical protein CME05_03410 [Gemmatimonadaceae bacterium]|nr:hypothetical protein [Gemmatimonadaceae bacterium]